MKPAIHQNLFPPASESYFAGFTPAGGFYSHSHTVPPSCYATHPQFERQYTVIGSPCLVACSAQKPAFYTLDPQEATLSHPRFFLAHQNAFVTKSAFVVLA